MSTILLFCEFLFIFLVSSIQFVQLLISCTVCRLPYPRLYRRQNSIIIVGGDNTSGWSEKMSGDELEIVSNAGVVLLQRVIPDSINIQVSKENDIAFGTGM
ncbi:hypothetical protein Bca4012_092524 [Brassica carinata]